MKCQRCGSTERYRNGRCAPCTRECNRRWKANNRERHRVGSRRWDEQNPEARRKAAREWARRNKTVVAARKKAWRDADPARHAAHEQARRARKGASGGSYTAEQWNALCAVFHNSCLRCGSAEKRLTVDHVVPLSAGGSNDILNLQPLCGPCNSAKGTATVDYRIDWMTKSELNEAIPPAYTAWVGAQLLAHVQQEAIAA